MSARLGDAPGGRVIRSDRSKDSMPTVSHRGGAGTWEGDSGKEGEAVKITAITKYKHGELYAILKRINWTQAELARRTNVSATRIGEIINLKRRPTQSEADAIQKAIGTAGEYFDVLSEWPEAFAGLKKGYRSEQTVDIPMDRLIDHPEVLQIAAPEYAENDLEGRVSSAMLTMRPNDKVVLVKRFWENKTHEEIASEMNISRGRVHSIEKRALQCLNLPYRARKLMPHLYEGIYFPPDSDSTP